MATHHQVFEEHGTLRLAIDNIRLLLSASERPQLAGSRDKRMLEDLRAFDSMLTQHFMGEERGGYLVDVLRDHPELSHQVSLLEKDHEIIATMLKTVLAAWPGSVDSLPNSRPRKMLDELLDRLEAHEAAENGLMQEAVCVDNGTAG